MTDPEKLDELEARLRAVEGTKPEVGLADDNSTELFDIEGANEAMFEAADAIRTLRERNAALVEGLRHLVPLLEHELQARADESLSEEELIYWLGEEYGRHTTACRIRLAQSRHLIEGTDNG